MRGGFDLYGNYYASETEAMNAEMAQCAQIDASRQEQAHHSLEEEIYLLSQRVAHLEDQIKQLLETGREKEKAE